MIKTHALNAGLLKQIPQYPKVRVKSMKDFMIDIDVEEWSLASYSKEVLLNSLQFACEELGFDTVANNVQLSKESLMLLLDHKLHLTYSYIKRIQDWLIREEYLSPIEKKIKKKRK
jgi:hypothetical protein